MRSEYPLGALPERDITQWAADHGSRAPKITARTEAFRAGWHGGLWDERHPLPGGVTEFAAGLRAGSAWREEGRQITAAYRKQ